MDINEFWYGLCLRFNLKEFPQELHPEGKGFGHIHYANLEAGILVEKRSGGHTWRFQRVDSSYNILKYLDVNSDVLVLNLEAFSARLQSFFTTGNVLIWKGLIFLFFIRLGNIRYFVNVN